MSIGHRNGWRAAWIPLTALVWFAASGCGGGARPQVGPEGPWEVTVISGGDTTAVPTGDGDPAAARVVGVDESLGEGEWEVTVEAPGEVSGSSAPAPEGAEPGKPSPPRSEPAPDDGKVSFTYGYRLQILATSSMVLAETESARADSLFDLPVYVEYEPPFYKVRLGDFLTRDDATAALGANVQRHYEKAWVTETMVRRPKR